ncbi:MAG: tripartite tricarboxylate transporter TctB family protein [Desulfobacterales bacterium]|nr:tripartite tricarboxylate transporter TctB family protein [Desulfobacterales bacterium]
MQNNQINTQARDTSGMVLACLFILIAAISLWDTTNMMDSDSYVFPRAIAIALIVFSLLLIFWNLSKPVADKKEAATDASTIRRILLVAVMLVSCALMPWLGFLISGFATYILLMLVAMYDEWTSKKKLIYPLIAAAIVAGFYTLFSKLLLVPLPVGLLFDY